MSGLDQLGQAIAAEHAALRDGPRDRSALIARLSHVAQRATPAWRPGRLAILASFGVMLVATGLLAWPQTPAKAPALTATVAGAPTSTGAFVQAPPGQSRAIDFSDGTRIAMAPGARMRVLDLSDRGAHVSLEAGRARVAVVPKSRARWLLSAGPFSVHVTGTRFALDWDPEANQLELNLSQGQVEVAGCVFEQPYALRAGQRLRASCRERRFSVSDGDAEGDDGDGQPAAGPPAPVPEDSEASSVPGAAAARLAEDPGSALRMAEQPANGARTLRGVGESGAVASIRRLAAAGRYAEAFARARQAGFASLCARVDAATLVSLADSARYAGDREREAFALRKLRQRFGKSREAARAAFALGRISFDHRGAFEEAARWFSIYLREQPDGALTREARGRLLEARLRAGQRGAARRIATDYLRKHPRGPHAALASDTLAAPR